jgi:hypothetical protein
MTRWKNWKRYVFTCGFCCFLGLSIGDYICYEVELITFSTMLERIFFQLMTITIHSIILVIPPHWVYEDKP